MVKKTKKAIEKELKNNWTKYNSFNIVDYYSIKKCPMINATCLLSDCGSWEDATVVQKNYPLERNEIEWEIKRGRCKNPLITGEIRWRKE